MNQYWAAFFAILLGASFVGGWETRGWKDGMADARHGEAQQQVTIAAEQHVIKQVQVQGTINQTAEKNYEKSSSIIGAMYSTGVQPVLPATGSIVRRIPATAAGTSPASCARKSKVYRLTFEQCDLVKAGFDDLWDDWLAQSAVK